MTDLFVNHLAGQLLEIAQKALTGALRLSVDGKLRMAFFEQGALVYVVSEAPEEGMGPFLTRAGRLEKAADRLQLSQLEQQVTRKQTLVSLVLQNGIASEDALRGWLMEYACEVFARMFDAREGAAKLMPAIKADHPLSYGIAVPSLILEGVRQMRSDDVIAMAIGPRSYMVRPAADHSDRLQQLPLSYMEGLVASQVTHEISLDDLLTISGLQEADALRAILALRLVGAMDPFDEPKKLTDTGRLRMRQAAMESGVIVDAESAAVVLGMFATPPDEDFSGGPALSMGELVGTEQPRPTVSPPPAPQSAPAAPVAAPPRYRGDTARLRLLTSAYLQMADAEVAAGNFAAAAQCYESALAQRPGDLETLVAYGKMLGKRPGGVSSAEKVLLQACEAHPDRVEPRLALAILYKDAARYAQAEEAALEARRIQPTSSEVRKLLEELQGGGKGGFLSKFGRKSDKPSKVTPPSGAHSGASGARPAAQQQSQQTSKGASSDPKAGLRCRYCGQPCNPEARVCRRCGATL